VITPSKGIRDGSTFTVNVRYGGVPETIVGSPIVFGSPYGFIHTDDGAFMGDEPNATSTWIPLNDHPSDKASWTFRVTVPAGLEVIGNGRLVSHRESHGKSTWVWDERDPMSNYLATADIGQWEFKTGTTPGGIPETVAIDPNLRASNPAAMDFLLRHHGRGHGPLERHVRPVSVRLDRSHRGQRHVQRPVDRLFPRDADAAAVLGGAQHQHDRA
jgi:peptidase M1-like protein